MPGKLICLGKNGEEKKLGEFPVVSLHLFIGSDAYCDLRIKHSSVSPQHCLITAQKDKPALIRNLSRASPTLVNGTEIGSKDVELKDCDVIQIHHKQFKWRYDDIPRTPPPFSNYDPPSKIRKSWPLFKDKLVAVVPPQRREENGESGGKKRRATLAGTVKSKRKNKKVLGAMTTRKFGSARSKRRSGLGRSPLKTLSHSGRKSVKFVDTEIQTGPEQRSKRSYGPSTPYRPSNMPGKPKDSLYFTPPSTVGSGRRPVKSILKTPRSSSVKTQTLSVVLDLESTPPALDDLPGDEEEEEDDGLHTPPCDEETLEIVMRSSKKSADPYVVSPISTPKSASKAAKRFRDDESLEASERAAKKLKEEPPRAIDKKKMAALLQCHRKSLTPHPMVKGRRRMPVVISLGKKSPEVTPKNSPKVTPKKSPKVAPKKSPNVTPKKSPRNTPIKSTPLRPRISEPARLTAVDSMSLRFASAGNKEKGTKKNKSFKPNNLNKKFSLPASSVAKMSCTPSPERKKTRASRISNESKDKPHSVDVLSALDLSRTQSVSSHSCSFPKRTSIIPDFTNGIKKLFSLDKTLSARELFLEDGEKSLSRPSETLNSTSGSANRTSRHSSLLKGNASMTVQTSMNSFDIDGVQELPASPLSTSNLQSASTSRRSLSLKAARTSSGSFSNYYSLKNCLINTDDNESSATDNEIVNVYENIRRSILSKRKHEQSLKLVSDQRSLLGSGDYTSPNPITPERLEHSFNFNNSFNSSCQKRRSSSGSSLLPSVFGSPRSGKSSRVSLRRAVLKANTPKSLQTSLNPELSVNESYASIERKNKQTLLHKDEDLQEVSPLLGSSSSSAGSSVSLIVHANDSIRSNVSDDSRRIPNISRSRSLVSLHTNTSSSTGRIMKARKNKSAVLHRLSTITKNTRSNSKVKINLFDLKNTFPVNLPSSTPYKGKMSSKASSNTSISSLENSITNVSGLQEAEERTVNIKSKQSLYNSSYKPRSTRGNSSVDIDLFKLDTKHSSANNSKKSNSNSIFDTCSFTSPDSKNRRRRPSKRDTQLESTSVTPKSIPPPDEAILWSLDRSRSKDNQTPYNESSNLTSPTTLNAFTASVDSALLSPEKSKLKGRQSKATEILNSSVKPTRSSSSVDIDLFKLDERKSCVKQAPGSVKANKSSRGSSSKELDSSNISSSSPLLSLDISKPKERNSKVTGTVQTPIKPTRSSSSVDIDLFKLDESRSSVKQAPGSVKANKSSRGSSSKELASSTVSASSPLLSPNISKPMGRPSKVAGTVEAPIKPTRSSSSVDINLFKLDESKSSVKQAPDSTNASKSSRGSRSKELESSIISVSSPLLSPDISKPNKAAGTVPTPVKPTRSSLSVDINLFNLDERKSRANENLEAPIKLIKSRPSTSLNVSTDWRNHKQSQTPQSPELHDVPYTELNSSLNSQSVVTTPISNFERHSSLLSPKTKRSLKRKETDDLKRTPESNNDEKSTPLSALSPKVRRSFGKHQSNSSTDVKGTQTTKTQNAQSRGSQTPLAQSESRVSPTAVNLVNVKPVISPLMEQSASSLSRNKPSPPTKNIKTGKITNQDKSDLNIKCDGNLKTTVQINEDHGMSPSPLKKVKFMDENNLKNFDKNLEKPQVSTRTRKNDPTSESALQILNVSSSSPIIRKSRRTITDNISSNSSDSSAKVKLVALKSSSQKQKVISSSIIKSSARKTRVGQTSERPKPVVSDSKKVKRFTSDADVIQPVSSGASVLPTLAESSESLKRKTRSGTASESQPIQRSKRTLQKNDLPSQGDKKNTKAQVLQKRNQPKTEGNQVPVITSPPRRKTRSAKLLDEQKQENNSSQILGGSRKKTAKNKNVVIENSPVIMSRRRGNGKKESKAAETKTNKGKQSGDSSSAKVSKVEQKSQKKAAVKNVQISNSPVGRLRRKGNKTEVVESQNQPLDNTSRKVSDIKKDAVNRRGKTLALPVTQSKPSKSVGTSRTLRKSQKSLVAASTLLKPVIVSKAKRTTTNQLPLPVVTKRKEAKIIKESSPVNKRGRRPTKKDVEQIKEGKLRTPVATRSRLTKTTVPKRSQSLDKNKKVMTSVKNNNTVKKNASLKTVMKADRVKCAVQIKKLTKLPAGILRQIAQENTQTISHKNVGKKDEAVKRRKGSNESRQDKSRTPVSTRSKIANPAVSKSSQTSVKSKRVKTSAKSKSGEVKKKNASLKTIMKVTRSKDPAKIKELTKLPGATLMKIARENTQTKLIKPSGKQTQKKVRK